MILHYSHQTVGIMAEIDMLKLAGRKALSKLNNDEDLRHFFLGAVAKREDGTIVHSRNGSAPAPSPDAHAEARVCRKAGKGATVYVARIRRDTGEFGMARPCIRCQEKMKNFGVKKCYFTVSSHEIGIIVFDNSLKEKTKSVKRLDKKNAKSRR